MFTCRSIHSHNMPTSYIHLVLFFSKDFKQIKIEVFDFDDE
jgi:hypothetical protein